MIEQPYCNNLLSLFVVEILLGPAAGVIIIQWDIESSTWPEAMKNMNPLQWLHGVVGQCIVIFAQEAFAFIDVCVTAFVPNISVYRHGWRGLSAEQQVTLKFIRKPPASNLSQLLTFGSIQHLFPLEEREKV